MLQILGSGATCCDGMTRRSALWAGGLSLFAGMQMPRLLEAREKSPRGAAGPAESVILLNLLGGPPHMDLFDLKPNAPVQVRGEFKPISTSVPDLQIGELLPLMARQMDKCVLLRTYSHKYNSHNPYNVFTGFDGGNDRENYFAKRSDHPSIAAVWQKFQPPGYDVPPYVVMPAYPGHSQALRRSGPYGGYLGSQYDPLFTVWTPKFDKPGGFYAPTTALGSPVLPSVGALPDVTADRLDRRRSLLTQLDDKLATLERTRTVEGMGHYQQQVFTLLTSAKTRNAFDLAQEPDVVRDRYGRQVWGESLLMARRLVEAGSRFISVNWEEANSGNHWDMHSNNFGMCRYLVPTLDQIVSALISDLDERGLLNSTLVIVMGEMGRAPRINGSAGRDHWPQCGFVLMAGGGLNRGQVYGRTDDQAGYPVDHAVSAGDLAATIYHLLGVDHAATVEDLSGRPIGISHGGEPVWEIIT